MIYAVVAKLATCESVKVSECALRVYSDNYLSPRGDN
jgi:hypothetical protein